jgi:hypothetical protein
MASVEVLEAAVGVELVELIGIEPDDTPSSIAIGYH